MAPFLPSKALQSVSGSIKWFVILVIAVLVYKYLTTLPQSRDLEVEYSKHGLKGKLTSKSESASAGELEKMDPSHFYVDSGQGFAFQLLPRDRWSSPQTLVGIAAIEEASMGVASPPAPEGLPNPLTEVLNTAHAIRFVSGQPLRIELTPQTTDARVEWLVNEMRRRAQSKNEPFDSEKFLADFNRKMGPLPATFSNEVVVIVFDKTVSGVAPPMSLATFYTLLSGPQGILELDQLDADPKKRSILVGGSKALRNVRVNGRLGDFLYNRASLFREGGTRLYRVDVGYSGPPSSAEWSDIQGVLKSFAIVSSDR